MRGSRASWMISTPVRRGESGELRCNRCNGVCPKHPAHTTLSFSWAPQLTAVAPFIHICASPWLPPTHICRLGAHEWGSTCAYEGSWVWVVSTGLPGHLPPATSCVSHSRFCRRQFIYSPPLQHSSVPVLCVEHRTVTTFLWLHLKTHPPGRIRGGVVATRGSVPIRIARRRAANFVSGTDGRIRATI